MSAWAYKKCPDCKTEGIHLNTMCDCGGDPWSVEKDHKENLEVVDKQIASLKSSIKGLKLRRQMLIDKWKRTNTKKK